MAESSNSYSIKSSLLTDEMLLQRRKNERFALIIGLIAQFVWAINSIQLKTYKKWFPEAYSNNSIVFWRSLPIWVLGYFFCKYKNIPITPHSKIKHLYWFFFRSFGNYMTIYLWVIAITYFRVSTCQCISGCNPIIVTFLSIWILHESFYTRYIYGIFFCLIGTALIVKNETKGSNKDEPNNGNIYIGLSVILTHLTLFSFSTMGQKILSKQGMHGDEQNYYLGVYNTIPALICMIFENHYGLSSFLYIIYSISNGFIFYLANYLTALALENISINKFLPMTYMNIVFVFILGFLFLGENVYFTDIFGSMLIMGFQIYNVVIPCGKVVDPNKIKINENNIQK